MSAIKRQVNDELDALEVQQAQDQQPAPAGNVVVLAERGAVSPLDLPAEVFKAGLARRKENRAALMGWVKESLVESTDFGRIATKRGLSKPSLWKPGAEKICGMLGVTVHYPNLSAYEDAALAGKTLAAIILRCELRDSQGRMVAEGIGARSVQQDGGDLNKSLKMAGKSAHIDAVLRMAGLSEVFTQDLEDQRQPPEPEAPKPERISPKQIMEIEAAILKYELNRERVKGWVCAACKVSAFEELTPSQFGKVLSKIDSIAAQEHEKAERADARTMAQEAMADAEACPF